MRVLGSEYVPNGASGSILKSKCENISLGVACCGGQPNWASSPGPLRSFIRGQLDLEWLAALCDGLSRAHLPCVADDRLVVYSPSPAGGAGDHECKLKLRQPPRVGDVDASRSIV